MKHKKEFTKFQWDCIRMIAILHFWGAIARPVAEEWTRTVIHSEEFKAFMGH